uniref:Uncharacterized protein n=1 Tax=Neogobius melanostomus TaxID=47308 RepID=A0A8C6WHF7_9GOBI
MLSSYGHPFFGLSQDLSWSGLWPEVRPLLHQRDNVLRDLHCSLQLMDSLQDHFMEDTCFPHALSQPHTKVQPFVLRLDAHGFSPEELSAGRRKTKRRTDAPLTRCRSGHRSCLCQKDSRLKTCTVICLQTGQSSSRTPPAHGTLRDRESCPSRGCRRTGSYKTEEGMHCYMKKMTERLNTHDIKNVQYQILFLSKLTYTFRVLTYCIWCMYILYPF